MKKAVKTGPPRKKATSRPTNSTPRARSWVGRVPLPRPGRYSDGLPLHEVGYLCCKLILKPNRFVSRQSLFDFSRAMWEPAERHGVGITPWRPQDAPLKIREVVFLDTPDFRFYNNAFILRRRIPYVDGFPVGDPEIVFKFRHPDMQKAAETDVRPHIRGDHRVKFKCQALPLKDRLGGIRMLYSHNVQFPRSSAGQGPVLTMEALTGIFPVLERIKKSPEEKIQLVSDTIVEEVLQDICLLDFGSGVTTKANVAIWRTRGEHRPLIGEFAFQFRFRDRKELTREAMQRAEAFFLALQYSAADWISLTSTKTGAVYGLLGNKPTSHE